MRVAGECVKEERVVAELVRLGIGYLSRRNVSEATCQLVSSRRISQKVGGASGLVVETFPQP